MISNPLATPDFFPVKIDLKRNTLLFHRMSRDSLQRSAFLDRRAIRASSETLLAEASKLRLPPAQRPVHFILHTAFCGSTLLARYLEILPHCLVLKEPGILGELSGILRTQGNTPLPASPDWFDITVALLARGYESDSAVVIKAADMCNWMGGLFLARDEHTKIIFLFSPLKIFLLQVLKVKHRREWLREHMRHLSGLLAILPFFPSIDVESLTDGQRAGAMWLLNSVLCRNLLDRAGADRVLVLDGEKLLLQPPHGVSDVARFLGLLMDESNRAALDTMMPLRHHAKDSNLPYDAAMRAEELRVAEHNYGDEVEGTLSWVKAISGDWILSSPFPTGDGSL